MNSFAEIIAAKGGPKIVADRLGLRPVTIRAWKSRDWIPRQHWPDIIAAYRDVTLKRLMELEARNRPLVDRTDHARLDAVTEEELEEAAAAEGIDWTSAAKGFPAPARPLPSRPFKKGG